jgi:hypothetical protein
LLKKAEFYADLKFVDDDADALSRKTMRILSFLFIFFWFFASLKAFLKVTSTNLKLA